MKRNPWLLLVGGFGGQETHLRAKNSLSSALSWFSLCFCCHWRVCGTAGTRGCAEAFPRDWDSFSSWNNWKSSGAPEGAWSLQCHEWNIIKNICNWGNLLSGSCQSGRGRRGRGEKKQFKRRKAEHNSFYETLILSNICWITWGFFFPFQARRKNKTNQHWFLFFFWFSDLMNAYLRKGDAPKRLGILNPQHCLFPALS